MRFLTLLVVLASYKFASAEETTTAPPAVDAPNDHQQQIRQQLEQQCEGYEIPGPSSIGSYDNSIDGSMIGGKQRKISKDKKTYICEYCGKDYKSSSTLNRHTNFHRGEKPYSCQLCGKSLISKQKLERHMETHTGEKPYSCSRCSKVFNHKRDLKYHMRTHTGEKPYSCQLCDKAFSRKSALNKHVRTHTGEKPYSCQLCDKAFSHKNSLEDHVRTHTGEKPYICDACSKSFIQKGHLIHHMRTHTGEKPYTCDVCSKSFSRKSTLGRHMRMHTDTPCEGIRDDVRGYQEVRQYKEEHISRETIDVPYDLVACQVKKESLQYCDIHGNPAGASGTQNYASCEDMEDPSVVIQDLQQPKDEPISPEIADVPDFGGWLPKEEEMEFCEGSEMSTSTTQDERAHGAESNSMLRSTLLATMDTDECDPEIEIKNELEATINKEKLI